VTAPGAPCVTEQDAAQRVADLFNELTAAGFYLCVDGLDVYREPPEESNRPPGIVFVADGMWRVAANH
jgi:hypothetical protein